MLRSLLLLLMLFTASFQSLAENKQSSSYENIIGKYTYTQQGDELIDGKNASITWVLNFLPEGEVKVSITSWHAPFTCDGLYQTEKDNNEIKLTWLSGEGSEMECDTQPPQFIAKQNTGTILLIKSSLFPWDDEKWFALNKIN
ncbi:MULTISPECIES: hypothetical protein [Pantoea]|uniref:hypothetical protein n=1 Tax=Pantoea TaxID=53335 RepID=UPI001C973EA3|nr:MULTISPECIES: hypothetical protein [Pantoea]MBY4951471.1 hypothetical protein [Pantoea sp. DY-17]